jgi:hypothetical protein
MDEYERQADQLLDGWRRGSEAAIEIVRTMHPWFRDGEIRWLPRQVGESEVRAFPLDSAGARLALARWYDFAGWSAVELFAAGVQRDGRFEAAVEAVIDGDLETLRGLLRDSPELARSRSARVTHFDPPVHRATLLHYVAANGVEGYRQRTPANAVEIARLLFESGAEADALADLYGGQHAPLPMLVSSSPPAQAGVQVPLVDVFVDGGASVDGCGSGAWTSPLMTALVFGYVDAAEALVRRGARTNSLPAVAGLGKVAEVRESLPEASPEDRHRALALAAQLGQAAVVELMLDAGEDPNRYNPPNAHSHSTPLHQAAIAGHLPVVKLLVQRGAQLDIKDKIYQSTPLGWAEYGGQRETTEFLRLHAG